MRVAFVTESWLPSVNGVVTRLLATAGELRRHGHEVMVLAPSGRDGEVPGVHVRTVPSVGLPFVYGGQPWGLPLPRTRRLLAGFAADVIHAVSPVLLGWAGVVFARAQGLPLVCSYHTNVARYAHFYHLGFAERPAWRLTAAAHRHAHVNLAASEAARRELESRGVAGASVWPAGVDVSRFHPGRADAAMRSRLSGGHAQRRLALYVGRLAAEKGLERTLDLVPAGSDWHLALVGEGPARAELEARFATAQATFVGQLLGDDLARAYASADLFCFPSTTDTLGLVLLEAMASGLPVVAARSGPSRDLLGARPSTALFDPQDRGRLREAAASLVLAAPDRGEIARTARARTPTWETATAELLERYEEAIWLARRQAAA